MQERALLENRALVREDEEADTRRRKKRKDINNKLVLTFPYGFPEVGRCQSVVCVALTMSAKDGEM